jgi:uncharacterized protein
LGLEMKNTCERCTAALAENDTAFICVYECTFCQDCTEDMNNICPNCGGELVRRPMKSVSA